MVGVSSSVFFFFKQKTAYEMRISDGSSDVCSSDLARDPASSLRRVLSGAGKAGAMRFSRSTTAPATTRRVNHLLSAGTTYQGACGALVSRKIGRASCRERVCQYV